MFTAWTPVCHDRNHIINIMAEGHAQDCGCHGHCAGTGSCFSSVLWVCLCPCSGIFTCEIQIQIQPATVMILIIASFTPGFTLKFLFLFYHFSATSVQFGQNKIKIPSAVWVVLTRARTHTHAHTNSGFPQSSNALVVVSLPWPNYC